MEQAEYISTILTQSLSSVFLQFVIFIPRLLAAIIIMTIGFLVARWTKWLTIRLLKTLGLHTFLKGSPVEKFLERAEIASKADHIVGDVVRWFVLLVFTIAAVNVLGLDTVSVLLTNILTYIPNVLAALVILILGTLLAGVMESFIKASVSNISVSTARLVSRIGSYIVMIFTVLAAIAQLGIASNLIYILFIGFVAMLALGLGLAFGFGAKDLVSKILDEWYSNLKKDNS